MAEKQRFGHDDDAALRGAHVKPEARAAMKRTKQPRPGSFAYSFAKANTPWRKFLVVAPYLGVVLALAIMLYYPVSEAIDAYHREQIAETLDVQAEETDDSYKEEMLAQATAWNRRLAGLTPDIPTDQIWDYEDQLSDGTTDAFAYLVIPKINLAMPIYHGLSDAVLSAGCGHSDTSSLPIGGESTHTVISAHSGMAGMRAFDDIRELQAGDVFGVRVLGEMRCWRVTSIEVVEPTDLDSLAIQAGRDLATLVTCTPYGVNTHRLLVHAERCEVPDGFGWPLPGPAEAFFSPRALPALIGLAVVGVFALALFVRRRMRNRRRADGASQAAGVRRSGGPRKAARRR